MKGYISCSIISGYSEPALGQYVIILLASTVIIIKFSLLWDL